MEKSTILKSSQSDLEPLMQQIAQTHQAIHLTSTDGTHDAVLLNKRDFDTLQTIVKLAIGHTFLKV